jgi:Protein of unknown function (DUF3515)
MLIRLPIVAAIAAVSLASVLLAGCGSRGSGPGGSGPGGSGPGGSGPGGSGPGGSAVRLVPPRPARATTRRCAALAGLFPSRLDGHARRSASPSSPLTAAWGDPPIALRCGVPLPAALTPTAELTVVNGVSWFPEPPGSATPTRFTGVGRQAYVEVTIPARYAPAGPILVAISNVLARAIPAKPGGKI